MKYLGRFGTSTECEAACLSYKVGSTLCRSFLYHHASYAQRKFRHTCFAITDTAWQPRPEPDVVSGRVFGPLAQVQRMLVWYVRQVQERMEAGWYLPWDFVLFLALAPAIHTVVYCAARRASASSSAPAPSPAVNLNGGPAKAPSSATSSPRVPRPLRASSSSSSLHRETHRRASSTSSVGSRHRDSAGSPGPQAASGSPSGSSRSRDRDQAGSHRYTLKNGSPSGSHRRAHKSRDKGERERERDGEGAQRLRLMAPKSHDSYQRSKAMPPPMDSLEEGAWL